MEQLQEEIWKPIIYREVDYTGIYEVSNMGRVRSLKQRVKLLKPIKKSTGYTCVSLGKVKPHIHSLVANAFLTNRKKGFVIDHINNKRADNRLSNLQIITHRANVTKQIEKASLMPCGAYSIRNKFGVQIRLGSPLFKMGVYNDIDEAAKAYEIAKFTYEQNEIINDVFKAIDNYRKSIGLNPIKRRL